jgi:hypothetical protein
MRFAFDKTPMREAVRRICEAYHLTLDDESMPLDGCLTVEFQAESAEQAVQAMLSGTPFNGWIEQGWGRGVTLLIIHDDRALEKPLAYGHDEGTIEPLLRAIPEIFSLGVNYQRKSLGVVAPFSVNAPLRQVLDEACSRSALSWRLDRGVVYVSKANR